MSESMARLGAREISGGDRHRCHVMITRQIINKCLEGLLAVRGPIGGGALCARRAGSDEQISSFVCLRSQIGQRPPVRPPVWRGGTGKLAATGCETRRTRRRPMSLVGCNMGAALKVDDREEYEAHWMCPTRKLLDQQFTQIYGTRQLFPLISIDRHQYSSESLSNLT